MSFVPFNGVSHQQPIILVVLCYGMKLESFVRLLCTWLEAMNEVCPKTIITYQDVVITNVVARVFHKSRFKTRR